MYGNASLDCPVCRKHRGEVEIPGGVIYQNELIFVSHAQLWNNENEHYLGHVFVESKRHVAEVADLTAEEARAIGLYTSRIAKGLLYSEKMEHIYVFVIGDGVPHVHYHVIGRYPGAPREFWGPKVDEWPGAPQGTSSEIAMVAGRLRAFLKENYPEKE